MYRLIFIIIAVLAISLGLLVGTLNSDVANVDLLWVQFQWPLGLLILCVFTVGILAGALLCWLFGIMPLRVRLRKSGGKELQRPNG